MPCNCPFPSVPQTYIRSRPDLNEPGSLILLGCGTVSSTAGQLASYPLNLVRTRLQASSKRSGFVQEFQHVVREGGVRALYRGLLPNFLKVAPAVSCRYGCARVWWLPGAVLSPFSTP